MNYRQFNAEEGRALAALRTLGLNKAEIARALGRPRSTAGRELKRHSAPDAGGDRSARARQRAHARRGRSRRHRQFGRAEWARVEALLQAQWRPEQVSGHLERSGELALSHETICRHVWRGLQAGGKRPRHLRGARKPCRKRDGRPASRGRLAGQRMNGARPAVVARSSRSGDWEIATVRGESLGESRDCILTLVARKTGDVLSGKLKARPAAESNRALLALLARHPGRVKTTPADHGTEFHWSAQIAAVSPVRFSCATPHHRWERGTNENHQRADPAVSAQGPNDEQSKTKQVRPDRRQTKQPTEKKTWLQNTQSRLPSPLTNVALQS